jgi:hypothetical protein
MGDRFDTFLVRLGVFGELWRMAARSKRWWLVPMMVVLVVLGLVLTGLQAVPYLSPFIYAVL